MSGLRRLYLGENALSGPVPPELGNLSAPQSLWLDHNMLGGPLLPQIGNLSGLRVLDLRSAGSRARSWRR